MKQKWLAQKIGVSEVTLSNWVNGKAVPKEKHLEKLCEILEINTDILLTSRGQFPHHFTLLQLRRIFGGETMNSSKLAKLISEDKEYLFQNYGDRLPAELAEQLEKLEKNLA